MINGKHIRAARAWLNWTQDDLVKQTGLSKQALWSIEAEAVEQPRVSTLNKIVQAFDQQNIRLLENGIQVIERNTILLDSFADVLYDADQILRKGDIIYFHCADDRRSPEYITEALQALEKRGVNLRFTYERGNDYFTTDPQNYRWIDPELFASSNVETTYADRHIIQLKDSDKSYFQMTKNKANAQTRQKQIEYFWTKGEKPHG